MTDVVAIIEKNARERVQVELSKFKGHDLIGIRVYADKGGGEWVATPKGITLRVGHLRDLVGALHAAGRKASEAGLI